jgi:NADP-dependent 3-hydroxy acid dehydrogenase YdfG
MTSLAGKIAWVTGAGSGIGEAAALALSDAGATVVLTGRRREPLEDVARRINAKGAAHVQPADLTIAAQVQHVGDHIRATFNRLDILVNNAGLNILERHWSQLTPERIDTLLQGNLTSALYCVTVALPFMRAQKDGVLIHTASMAGRFIGNLSGPIYTVAKHGVVAMSHGLNMQECVNGIRSTVFLPGEVATPILDRRPKPVSAEERARMVQPEDCGDLIRYIACLPKHVVMNEVHLSPTWNRGYVAALERGL